MKEPGATEEEQANTAPRPPNSVLLSEMPFDPPKPGMVVWAAINSLPPRDIPGFNLSDFGFGIGFNEKGTPGLWYRVDEGDIERADASDWQFLWIKMGNIVQTMSILTIGNQWIGNRLWSEGKVAWERPQGVPLVPNKEYSNEFLPSIPGVPFGVALVNLRHHIAMNFPRAWLYHEIGCYLLRSSFPGHDFSADALLNFFKVGELITAVMYHVKPSLKHIQGASQELGINDFSSGDIKTFYKVRGRDVAHDWRTAQTVDRADAVDCKMWSELMIINHWQEKGYDVVGLTPNSPRAYDPKKHGPIRA